MLPPLCLSRLFSDWPLPKRTKLSTWPRLRLAFLVRPAPRVFTSPVLNQPAFIIPPILPLAFAPSPLAHRITAGSSFCGRSSCFLGAVIASLPFFALAPTRLQRHNQAPSVRVISRLAPKLYLTPYHHLIQLASTLRPSSYSSTAVHP